MDHGDDRGIAFESGIYVSLNLRLRAVVKACRCFIENQYGAFFQKRSGQGDFLFLSYWFKASAFLKLEMIIVYIYSHYRKQKFRLTNANSGV